MGGHLPRPSLVETTVTSTTRRGKSTALHYRHQNWRGAIRYDLWVNGYSIQCANCADILSRVSFCDASQAPPPPPEPSPLFGSLCGAAGWDRGPGLYTWNASCPGEALPLFCVFEKLCTNPLGEMEGPLVQHTALLGDGAHKHKTYLLSLYSEI